VTPKCEAGMMTGKDRTSVEKFNPLTPELNPSAHRSLTKFFTVDFAF
jgi:hypothetical protein